MSREIQPNVTNIFNDQTFVCGSQLQYEDPKDKFLSFNKIREALVKVMDFLLILDYGVDEGPQNFFKKRVHLYILRIYIHGNLTFQMWSSYA
jgi:hypothetical protein